MRISSYTPMNSPRMFFSSQCQICKLANCAIVIVILFHKVIPSVDVDFPHIFQDCSCTDAGRKNDPVLTLVSQVKLKDFCVFFQKFRIGDEEKENRKVKRKKKKGTRPNRPKMRLVLVYMVFLYTVLVYMVLFHLVLLFMVLIYMVLLYRVLL